MAVLRQITRRLWQLELCLPFSTNVWLVRESDGLTLVDAAYPWNARAILRAVQQVGAPLRRILVTHAHPDHAGAAAALSELTGAEIMAHPEDVPYLLGQASMADLPGFWLCRLLLRSGRRLHMLNPPPVARVTPVHEGTWVGGLQVMHTPGHTPGSIMMWDSEERALFCGDNAAFTFGFLHLGVPWFTLDATRRNDALRRACRLPAEMLLAGHGPVFRRPVGPALEKLIR
ncbi:MAG: MBL fold metallo-hydrolase [Candidatus Xenobia bacterium]